MAQRRTHEPTDRGAGSAGVGRVDQGVDRRVDQGVDRRVDQGVDRRVDQEARPTGPASLAELNPRPSPLAAPGAGSAAPGAGSAGPPPAPILVVVVEQLRGATGPVLVRASLRAPGGRVVASRSVELEPAQLESGLAAAARRWAAELEPGFASHPVKVVRP